MTEMPFLLIMLVSLLGSVYLLSECAAADIELKMLDNELNRLSKEVDELEKRHNKIKQP